MREAGLYCWGENYAGQLGTGDVQDFKAPVAVPAAGADIVEVEARSGRTCIRRRTGEIACWGLNDVGQIGDGTRSDSLTPVPAKGIDDALQLAAQDQSTCALRRGAVRVSCWGMARSDAPDGGALEPQAIAGLEGALELRGGSLGTYCARGESWLKCWRFKDGEWTEPAAVPAFQSVRALAVTFEDEVCAIMQDRSITCTNLDSGNAVELRDSSGSVEITSSGELSACARNEAGAWHCWNVLPVMLESVGSSALEVASPVPVREVAIGGLRMCVVREDNQVACADADSLGLPKLTIVDFPR